MLPECSPSAPECSRVLPECSRVLPCACTGGREHDKAGHNMTLSHGLTRSDGFLFWFGVRSRFEDEERFDHSRRA